MTVEEWKPRIRVESPFPIEAWPRVWFWMDAFRGRVTDDFSPTTIDEFVPEMIELASRVETWGVWRGEGSEEELGGMVSVLVESRNPRLGLARSLFKQDFWVGPRRGRRFAPGVMGRFEVVASRRSARRHSATAIRLSAWRKLWAM